MRTEPLFEIEFDVTRNLTRIRYGGTITAGHLATVVIQLEALLPQLQPGFTALVDMSELDAMDLDCVPHLSTLMELCKARGIGTVIRVIPDPAKDIGLNILSLIHYRGKVRIITCDTRIEAEQHVA